jgi:hypothetical protein
LKNRTSPPKPPSPLKGEFFIPSPSLSRGDLGGYLKQKRKEPFIWGKNDCYCFVTNWLDVRFGAHNRLKLEYSSKEEAIELAVKYKWEDELKKYYEISPSWPLLFTADGDIVISRHAEFECAGLVYKDKVYSVSEEFGLTGISLSFFTKYEHQAWRVISCLN